MRIDILTLFPKMFDGFLSESIIKRAIDKEKVKINIIDIRDYTPYKNNQVDDYQFGGGGGMIMMCEPVFNAVESVRTKDSHVILLTPRGKTYNEKKAKELKELKHLIIICGHYEGFDERIYTLADSLVSIGDFILTGGEIPAMAIADSVVRLIDGVITSTSLETESFNDNLLDYPVYTKPREYRGMAVPLVLLNGNHKLINEFREEERKRITKEYRDDLL
ncbi:tRNA (guanine-N(1)-)-methyltransferase [Clostridium sp. CAG:1000]|nr:tRNA (guanine-N(1)-)-methyltransferase [Clostridium sp. CAG:1000]